MQKLLTGLQDLQQIFITNLRKLKDDPAIINFIRQKKCNNIYCDNKCIIILVSQSNN